MYIYIIYIYIHIYIYVCIYIHILLENEWGRTHFQHKLGFQSLLRMNTATLGSHRPRSRTCSRHKRCSVKKRLFLKMSQNSKKSTCYQSYNFIKNRIQHRNFPLNFAKFLWTPSSQNTSGRLLLTWVWLMITTCDFQCLNYSHCGLWKVLSQIFRTLAMLF